MLHRLPLFPTTTAIDQIVAGEGLTIARCDLAALASNYGTPLYLYDQATMDIAVATYQTTLAKHYSGPSGITYAGKAYFSVALAQWTKTHKLWVDCTGVGELQVALAARVPRERILVHGVNKSPADLAAAVMNAGTIVVDHLGELDRLIALAAQSPYPFPDLWLRVRPGLAVDTHSYTQTGQHDSKFGMNPEEIVEAAYRCRQHNLNLNGLHFHQGSFFLDPEPVGVALETALDLMSELSTDENWTLSPGGGWGVAYHEDDLPHPQIESYVRFIAEKVTAGCRARALPLPSLQLEPGRSLVAQAGVALYRVGAVKQTGDRRWLLLDGGLADNPRPALYGTRYSALPVHNPGRPIAEPAWLAGPFCESGDILIEALPMPEIEVGELIAVPMSGAYQLSMASNYNGARRPAVLWLKNGYTQLIQARETKGDLIRRDRGLHAPTDLGDHAETRTTAPSKDAKAVLFTKYEALGNDYLVVESQEDLEGLTPRQIRHICDRNYGVGSDGILFVELNDPHHPFRLRIYNPDGSESETSGNGLRIYAQYLYDRGLVGEAPFSITTEGRDISARVFKSGEMATVEMGQVSFESERIPVKWVHGEVLNKIIVVEGQEMVYSAATVGNPHCVVMLDSVSKEVAIRLGPSIEIDKRFPNRTNVQFMQVLDRENIRIEIWERGAGYTLASGSSSCAAAAVAHRLDLCDSKITVHMPGGKLQVDIQEDFTISLTGPVSKVYKGEVLIDEDLPPTEINNTGT